MSRHLLPLGLLLAFFSLLPASQAAADHWLVDGLRGLLDDCPLRPSARTDSQGGLVRAVCECAQRRAWRAIDRILDDDLIPLLDGVELVKLTKGDEDAGRGSVNASVTHSIRKLLEGARGKGQDDEPADQVDPARSDWRGKLGSRLARVLGTHVIKIDADKLRTKFQRSSDGKTSDIEPRGRRRRKQMQMMPIVMMGVMLMGSVLIPMGFQFLAVLGGKALILAKMALMLSSIQGLKKIATSGVNYGLYHTGVPEPWHERSSYLELPYEAHAQPGPVQQHPAIAAGPYLDHYIRRSGVQPT